MQFLNEDKPDECARWFACLELGFKAAQDRTILKHRWHSGPIRVQKMLWPEKTGVCHAIIVHPPAGIAGGDHLTFKIHVDEEAHALVTTLVPENGIRLMRNRLFSIFRFRLKIMRFLNGSSRNHAVQWSMGAL